MGFLLLSALRTVILFSTVTLVMRIMGKRQVGEMQPYELVITILIAELAAIPMEDTDIPLLRGLIPIVILLALQVGLSELALFSEKARKIICGCPSIVISQGEIDENELRKIRVNLNDLLEQLRNKNYPNISDVHYAILETNGQLSVIPKAGLAPVTPADLNLFPPTGGLPINLVLDGVLNEANLRLAEITKEQLLLHAEKRGIKSIEELFFANIDETGALHLQAKRKKGE